MFKLTYAYNTALDDMEILPLLEIEILISISQPHAWIWSASASQGICFVSVHMHNEEWRKEIIKNAKNWL